MKVLIADDNRGHRHALCKLLEREPEVQVSGIAEDEEMAPDRVIARELRRILDGCPICNGGYGGHTYVVLATVAMENGWYNSPHLKQYFDLLEARRWGELLRIREWNGVADAITGFAFRCAAGRVGILTMFCPAKPNLPDTPLHYVILPSAEQNKLLGLLPPETWLPLRSASSLISTIR